MQRYFIDKSQIDTKKIIIKGDDVHHIKTVMRMQINDKILVCDEENTYLCKISNISNVVEAEIIETINDNFEMNINVTVAHGLVRREKMEEVVRRLVELGCYSYIPVNMTRSVVKHKEINIDRLKKIIKEASEQSQRTKLMKISEVINFSELIKDFNNYDLVLFAHTLYKDKVNLFNEIKNNNSKNILIIIGPEGGFDEKEVNQLVKYDKLKPISLGKRILRTETAPLYIMSVLGFIGEQYEG